MVLSDRDIKKALADKEILIEPLKDPKQVQPASVDLRLGKDFKRLERLASVAERNTALKVGTDLDTQGYKYVPYNADNSLGYIYIAPHEFLLATTVERVKIPNNMTAFLEGRSSVGRSGLSIHNAGYIDPGFEGQITLELYNALPFSLRLTPGMRICQIVFESLSSECEVSYSQIGKYQNQKGATGSRIYKDEF